MEMAVAADVEAGLSIFLVVGVEVGLWIFSRRASDFFGIASCRIFSIFHFFLASTAVHSAAWAGAARVSLPPGRRSFPRAALCFWT